jgi:myo-inositol-1(or 4)-monophosphatase
MASERPETLLAIEAVRRGLALAQRGAGRAEITEKGDRDLVTATDVAVEDEVRRILAEAGSPPVVGEERGGDSPVDGSAYWLLDPICGTRNYASGIPIYALNLALVEGGQVTVAVAGDPSNGEIDVAEMGRGAYALGDGARRPLRVSGESRILDLSDGRATGERRERAVRFAAAVIGADRWDVRALGSTLALAYLAAGRISAYVLFLGHGLHTAAGSLLVSEAGGSVTDIDGEPWTIQSNSIMASADAALHWELLDLAR